MVFVSVCQPRGGERCFPDGGPREDIKLPFLLHARVTIANKAASLEPAGLSFPKKLRLLRRRDFVTLYEQGRRFSTRHLLIALKQNDREHCRLGITISRKIDKRAVRRNLFKRRIREIFRLNQQCFTDNLDIVVTARSGAADCRLAALRAELLGALKQRKFITNPKSIQ